MLLALQCEVSEFESGLVAGPLPDPQIEAGRQLALSVPESVRALGEPLDPFFEACGGRTALSLAVSCRDTAVAPETCAFRQPFVLIGRYPECDLPLLQPGVSFRHVYLQLIAGRWFWVNLKRIAKAKSTDRRGQSGWFDPGNELTAGPYSIRHVALDPNALSRPNGPEADDGRPAVRLELVNGRSETRGRRSRRITKAITLVGARRACDIWLQDTSVSTVHASLVLTSRGLWVVDLLGREGIRVDDRPVYWKQIRDGEELQIGRFRFCVRYGAESDPLPRRLTSPAKDDLAVQATDSLSGGSLSGESVLSLVRQLAEMQNQFFEHSQLQMQLMSEMLAHLKGRQQVVVRQDLSRIDEIGRELKDIQLQLAAPDRSSAAAGTAPTQKPARRRKTTSTGAKRAAPDPQIEIESPVEAGPPSPQGQRSTEPPLPEPAHRQQPLPNAEQPTTGVGSQDAQSRLTRRMAKLAEERNNRWRRVLQAFKGKPDDAAKP